MIVTFFENIRFPRSLTFQKQSFRYARIKLDQETLVGLKTNAEVIFSKGWFCKQNYDLNADCNFEKLYGTISPHTHGKIEQRRGSIYNVRITNGPHQGLLISDIRHDDLQRDVHPKSQNKLKSTYNFFYDSC